MLLGLRYLLGEQWVVLLGRTSQEVLCRRFGRSARCCRHGGVHQPACRRSLASAGHSSVKRKAKITIIVQNAKKQNHEKWRQIQMVEMNALAGILEKLGQIMVGKFETKFAL